MSQQDQVKEYLAKIGRANMEVLELNTKFATQFVERQAQYLNGVIQSGVNSVKQSGDASDVRDFVETQRDFAQDLGRQVKDFYEANVEALKDNTTQVMKVYRNAFGTTVDGAAKPAAKAGTKSAKTGAKATATKTAKTASTAS